jgi:hypothetical protein
MGGDGRGGGAFWRGGSGGRLSRTTSRAPKRLSSLVGGGVASGAAGAILTTSGACCCANSPHCALTSVDVIAAQFSDMGITGWPCAAQPAAKRSPGNIARAFIGSSGRALDSELSLPLWRVGTMSGRRKGGSARAETATNPLHAQPANTCAKSASPTRRCPSSPKCSPSEKGGMTSGQSRVGSPHDRGA